MVVGVGLEAMMRSLMVGFVLGVGVSACQKQVERADAVLHVEPPHPEIETDPLLEKAAELRSFAEEKGYSTEVAFLVDLSQHSGQHRFYVWDFHTESARHKGLVAHGHCRNDENPEQVVFSNQVDSNCSSEGMYRIGTKYNGQFGTAFKLHGLQESNSAAFERFIVMHAHDCVPDSPQSEAICYSEGCPTLSPEMLQTVVKWLARPKSRLSVDF